jgi:transcriptional regulator with XRE-family HTH domain
LPDVGDAGSVHFYSVVGAKVRSARIEARISQAELAAQVGLTRSSVANLEAARQRTSLYHFVLISRVLNTDVNNLLPVFAIDAESDFSPHWVRELANSPESAQHFVRGAVARLRSKSSLELEEH